MTYKGYAKKDDKFYSIISLCYAIIGKYATEVQSKIVLRDEKISCKTRMCLTLQYAMGKVSTYELFSGGAVGNMDPHLSNAP